MREHEADVCFDTELLCIIECGAVAHIMVTDMAWLAEAQYVGITRYLCLVLSVCCCWFTNPAGMKSV